MKNFRENIDRFYDKLDNHWRALPVKRQHQYTLYFFVGYLLLTAGVIAKVWYDTRQSNNDMHIDHIENPMLKKNESPTKLQDTLSTIKK